MARRGFFAEMQHQAAMKERERHRAYAAAVKAAEKRRRDTERARVAAERAQALAARTDAKARVDAEREAKRLHIEAREAETEELNAHLQSLLAEIDGVLTWTLGVDDHVDLESLLQAVEHPAFQSPHETPIPPPPALPMPVEPWYADPPAPTGLSGVFKKKEHQAQVEQQRAAFAAHHRAWQLAAADVPVRQQRLDYEHRSAEAQRTAKLAADRATYDAECRQREAQVEADNAELRDLIRRYAAGEGEAVEEYCGIVFGNSIYPDVLNFGVTIDYHVADRELEISLDLPRPDELPTAKSYRYVKAKDEIAETAQPATEQRNRYADLINNIVLRTLHEMWESDHARHIDTISLSGGVAHIDPATGRPTSTPLVAVAVDRTTFEPIDLAHVMPAETMRHLKATVSKNPHGLAAISTTSGVRG